MTETQKRYGHLARLIPTVLLAGLLATPGDAGAEEPPVFELIDGGAAVESDIDSLSVLPVAFRPSHAGCASCPGNGWYLSASGGWQHRETVHEANDPATFLTFDDGFSANAALGYRFDCFRVEAETTFMNNEVDTAGAGGLTSSAAGNVNVRALMFNIYHDVDIDILSWKPYVGAGIGLYQSDINSLYPEFFDDPLAPVALNGTAVNTTSDIPFAYQFRVGLTRKLGPKTEFFTGYRHFRGEELEFAALPFSTFAPTFEPEGIKSHSIEFGVRINF